MEKIYFKANDSIFSKGDEADKMFKIIKGKVDITSTNETDATVLATLKDGAFFGEMGVIDKAVRSAAAIAATDVELLAIDAKSFEDFVMQNAPDVIDMMKNLTASIRRTTKEYIDATKTVENLIDSGKIDQRKTTLWEKLKNIALASKDMAAGLNSDSYIDDKRDYKKDEVIFRKGQTADRMFKLLEGEVMFFNDNNFGVGLEFATIGNGSVFGEMAVIDKTRRNAYAVAKTDVKLLPIASGDLQKYLETHADDAIKILKNLTRNLRNTTGSYVDTLKTINELVDSSDDIDKGDKGLWDALVRYSSEYNSFMTGSVSPDGWYLGMNNHYYL